MDKYNRPTYEWIVKDDVSDIRDCVEVWAYMLHGNRAGNHHPPHGQFTADPPEIELSEEDKQWVSLFPKWKDDPNEVIYDIGVTFPARIACSGMTPVQRDRLTRGLCDALFRPRRKEFVP
jgi:hypothetical protein